MLIYTKPILKMKYKVLVIAPIDPYLKDVLLSLDYEIIYNEEVQGDLFQQQIKTVHGIITSTKLKIDNDLIDNAVNLNWIGRLGSGMEHINVQYAISKGIKCFSSPAGNANAVAEQTLGALLNIANKISSANQELNQDIWRRDENRGWEIEGKSIGIIGLGNNGMRFAEKAAALGMDVYGYDKYRFGYQKNHIRELISLQEIYEKCEIISFHVPLTMETRHYFNQNFMDNMQHPFVLLNLCRGKVVDQNILLSGLQSGKIIGASLDVWEEEPITKMDASAYKIAKSLLALPNFIGTPHIAGYSVQASYKMSYIIAEEIKKTHCI